MKNTLYIICIISLLFFIACSQKLEVNNELKLAEELMDERYEQSLLLLQNLIDDEREMTEGETALFNLLLFQARDKNTLSLPDAELIDYSIDYFTRTNDFGRLASAYFYKARIYKYNREYQGAIQNLLKALELGIKAQDFSLLGKIHFDLGQISGYQDELDKALEHYWKAAAYFGEARQRENVARTYMVIGSVHMGKDMFDDAIYYAQQALVYTTDSVIIGDVLHDIGTAYYYSGNSDSALVYMHQSVLYPYFDTNMSMRYYNLANVYSYLGDYDRAIEYINKAFEYPIDIYIEEECYRILVKIAMEYEDKESLAEFIDKRQACNDSIRILEAQPSITVLEQLHDYDKHTGVMEKRISSLFLIIACILIAAIVIFLILYRLNKQKHHKAENYKSELEEKEKLLEKKEELIEKKDELIEKKDEILSKKHELLLHNFLNELKQTKMKYAAMRKKSDFAGREKIDKQIYAETFCFDNEAVFTDKMNKALNHLPDKLNAAYPNISFKELIWCCLFMLQIPTTDISLILDYKQSSLYKFKQRLGKKLGFNSLKDFEQMLQDKVDE